MDCPSLLFQYSHSYPPYLGTLSSVRNPWTVHVVVTWGPLNVGIKHYVFSVSKLASALTVSLVKHHSVKVQIRAFLTSAVDRS